MSTMCVRPNYLLQRSVEPYATDITYASGRSPLSHVGCNDRARLTLAHGPGLQRFRSIRGWLRHCYRSRDLRFDGRFGSRTGETAASSARAAVCRRVGPAAP